MFEIPIMNMLRPKTDIAYRILRGFPQKISFEHFQSPAHAKTKRKRTSLAFVAESKIEVLSSKRPNSLHNNGKSKK